MYIYKKILIAPIILYVSLPGCFVNEATNNADPNLNSVQFNKTGNTSTNYVGVNLSRYRSAVKGCYVTLEDGRGTGVKAAKL